MKIAALSLVYNEEALVKGCIRSLKPFVEPGSHVMVVGLKPYYGKAEEADRSFDIAAEEGAHVMSGIYKLDHQQRNDGLNFLDDGTFDWVLCSDVDMWFEHDTVDALIRRLKDVKEDAVVMAQDSYWKDTNHRLIGDKFMPVVAVRPHVRFSYIGNVDCPYHKISDLKLHHLAWCAPKDIKKKVMTYSHAPEFDGNTWYSQYYETWRPGMKAVLPTGRFDVEYNPLPDELREYLE